jgi:hypothetical protein
MRADDEKVGTTWADEDLDAIIEDYFVMLAADQAGQKYVKSRHSEVLMARIGRTHRSVEFKHQNISAVLDELGLPWIPGYKPKRNYQKAIFDAIDRYLTRNSAILDAVPERPSPPPSVSDVFVAPPSLNLGKEQIPQLLQRLVRKFDPVERDYRNRLLGKAGEEFVVGLERHQLDVYGRSDLAKQVRWVAAEDGDGAGYDVLSFDSHGRERLLEVKTTNGSARTPFFLTRNEYSLARERPEDWRIYRVHQFGQNPRVFIVTPPLEDALNLRTETWRASF